MKKIKLTDAQKATLDVMQMHYDAAIARFAHRGNYENQRYSIASAYDKCGDELHDILDRCGVDGSNFHRLADAGFKF